MRDPNKIIPDLKGKLKKDIEAKAAEIIKREYPEIKKFSANCDIDKQVMNYVGLTPEQEARTTQLLFQKN